MFYCCFPSENPGRCFRPHLFVICTGVTLFALVLQLNCTALSQSESSNFFMYIISIGNHMILSAIWDKSARVNFSKVDSSVGNANFFR